ncbi:hypothetical protein [Nocardia sp. NPDC004711]
MSATPSDPALFAVQHQLTAELSQRYSKDPDYRASAERKPSWAKITNPSARGAFCDECANLQHETGGKFGPRMQPRQRRHFPTKTVNGEKVGGGPALRLCTRHAEAWRERDDIDRSESATRTAQLGLRRANTLAGRAGTGNALADAVTRSAERDGMDR